SPGEEVSASERPQGIGREGGGMDVEQKRYWPFEVLPPRVPDGAASSRNPVPRNRLPSWVQPLRVLVAELWGRCRRTNGGNPLSGLPRKTLGIATWGERRDDAARPH